MSIPARLVLAFFRIGWGHAPVSALAQTVVPVQGLGSTSGVAIDRNGNLYGSTSSTGSSSPNSVFEVPAINGSLPPYASQTLRTLAGGFSSPQQVAVDGSGDVFVADSGNSAVKEIMAVNGSIPPSPTIRTVGSGFSQPAGLAFDGNGNLFVTDVGTLQIYEIQAVGGRIPPLPTIQTVNTSFSLFGPTCIAVDASNNLYVGDSNGNVYVIYAVGGSIPPSPTMALLRHFGTGSPLGLAVDGHGNVFVSTYRFTPSIGGLYEMLAVNGSVPPFDFSDDLPPVTIALPGPPPTGA